MIKLSDLNKDTKIICGESIYTVEEVRNDFKYFNHKQLYTTTECQASLNARENA